MLYDCIYMMSLKNIKLYLEKADQMSGWLPRVDGLG